MVFLVGVVVFNEVVWVSLIVVKYNKYFRIVDVIYVRVIIFFVWVVDGVEGRGFFVGVIFFSEFFYKYFCYKYFVECFFLILLDDDEKVLAESVELSVEYEVFLYK